MANFMSYHPSLSTSQLTATPIYPFDIVPRVTTCRHTDSIAIQVIHTIQINI